MRFLILSYGEDLHIMGRKAETTDSETLRRNPAFRVPDSQPLAAQIRRHRLIAASLLITVLLTAATGQAQDIVHELQTQFIHRFTQFIEWPSGSTVSNSSVPFVIGVLGDSKILPSLENLARSKTVKGKKLEVRQLSDLAEIGNCQILFISKSERSRLAEILGACSGKPLLSVSDTEGFATRGVMINFTAEGQTLRFEINKKSADSVGLKLAPKLLALGKVVEE